MPRSEGHSKTAHNQDAKLRTLERRTQAAQMRLAGATYKEIADRLGYANPSGPCNAVKALIEEVEIENGKQLLSQEMMRLDRMQLGVWPQAIQGDCGAIATVLKIMERRAKLCGLDAPEKMHVATSVAEEMAAFIERRKQEGHSIE